MLTADAMDRKPMNPLHFTSVFETYTDEYMENHNIWKTMRFTISHDCSGNRQLRICRRRPYSVMRKKIGLCRFMVNSLLLSYDVLTTELKVTQNE
jgi:hypothetical protein